MARDIASTRIQGRTRLSGRDPHVAGGESKPPPPESATPAPAGHALRQENVIKPLSLVPHRLTADERHRRICELAYRRAEQRGFAPGSEVEDWLEAEREVDAGRY